MPLFLTRLQVRDTAHSPTITANTVGDSGDLYLPFPTKPPTLRPAHPHISSAFETWQSPLTASISAVIFNVLPSPLLLRLGICSRNAAISRGHVPKSAPAHHLFSSLYLCTFSANSLFPNQTPLPTLRVFFASRGEGLGVIAMASASSQDGTWLNPPFSCDSYSPTATSSELTSIACPTPNSTSDVLEANSDASVAVRQRIESSYQGSGPTWSPASLLDPRRAQEQHRNLVVTGGSAAYDPSVLIANGALDFHFSTPADPFAETASEPTVAAPPTKGGNADDDVIILAANAFGSISTTNDETPSSLDTSRTTPQPIGARTPNGTPATRATVGQGETIERLAQAQDRPLEPALKRRKVEGLEPSLKKPNGYLGSGALGDFTVQTNQEHQLKLPGTSKQPVDLTIGMGLL